MIWKLSLTGIKSRFRDYAVLFSGLVVASTIFYMFLTLATNPSFMTHDVNAPSNYLTFIFGFGIVLLVVITLVYLTYANSFLLSMRKHDYGMFMMLGAKNSRIGLLIFCETLVIGILAALLGIGIGFGLTALVSKLLINNLGLQISHFQAILPSAILWTLVFFIVIFFFGALHNSRKLTHTKVIDLLHEDQQPVKLTKRSFLHSIEAVLGIALLAAGYHIMNMPATAIFFIVPAALVTIVLGSYFTFNSFFGAVVGFLINRKSFSYHGIRMFTLGQLKFRLRDYTRILTVISLLFALALGAITVGLKFDSLKDLAQNNTYYDATIVSDSPAIKRDVAKLDIKDEQTYHYKETSKELYFNRAELEKQPLKHMKFTYKNHEESWHQVTLPTSQLDKPRTDANNTFGGMVPNGLPKIIHLVSLQKLQEINGQNKFVSYLRVTDFGKDYPTILSIEKREAKENAAFKDIFQTSKANNYQMMIGLASGFEFMGFFLGLAFLTMLASTLMFKVLSGAASDKVRYKMLYKIGARQQVLRRSIKQEIGTLFLLPGVLGIIDVLFGLRLFRTLLPDPYSNIWVPFVIFIVLYLGYYLVTVKLYENIVLKQE
ncbi:ABC transporter permease [Lactobacillus sp. ESL0684]|uniref:FtsX-like permease family protein n=1 Tax=Lactobacillus sp. ESL0684 TaxID=2983213 RepID=UPI0023F86DEE|nr:ABC transporter permease [Lactobacillus sp. ESL0684]WEV43510.1 ABC transporter permease [Lactobacillus sp. ESL0684]